LYAFLSVQGHLTSYEAEIGKEESLIGVYKGKVCECEKVTVSWLFNSCTYNNDISK